MAAKIKKMTCNTFEAKVDILLKMKYVEFMSFKGKRNLFPVHYDIL